jgi:hypothetical protein
MWGLARSGEYVTKYYKSMILLIFLLNDGRIRIIQIMKDPDSDRGGPKRTVRIRIHSQHHFGLCFGFSFVSIRILHQHFTLCHQDFPSRRLQFFFSLF